MAERYICGEGRPMGMAIPVVDSYEADHVPTTSTGYWNYNSNDQYLRYVYVRYPSTKKRGFRFKKLYSTRARGRSSPLQSLARKICRFKVRTVLLGNNTTTGQSQSQQTK